MENPPLVKNLAYDSLLADTKLIAEALRIPRLTKRRSLDLYSACDGSDDNQSWKILGC